MVDGLGRVTPGVAGAAPAPAGGATAGAGPAPGGAGAPPAGGAAGSSTFDALLQQAGGLQFSRHARRRIEQRGLNLDAERMRRLANAVGQAEQKGSKDSLVLLDEMALVVSVQHHTVVTAMDGQSQKGNVFTNIDSVVIAH